MCTSQPPRAVAADGRHRVLRLRAVLLRCAQDDTQGNSLADSNVSCETTTGITLFVIGSHSSL